MRCYDEPIEACFGAGSYHDGHDELPGVPAEFRWRRRSWQICEIEGHWVMAEPWWEGHRVEPVRHHEVWQVRAREPWQGREGIFRLHRAHDTGQWMLHAVMD